MTRSIFVEEESIPQLKKETHIQNSYTLRDLRVIVNNFIAIYILFIVTIEI